MNQKTSVALASDHRGVSLKAIIADYLKSKGYRVDDLGPNSEASVDYPDYASKAAEYVASGKAEQGIVICHSGIGVSVTANKINGIRAALCQTPEQGELARRHTNANILALPAGFVTPTVAKEIVEKWLSAHFEGDRHQRRLDMIRDIEEKQNKKSNKGKTC